MRPLTALFTTALVVVLAVYGWRGWTELSWRGALEGPSGAEPPPVVDGPWWVLRAVDGSATTPEATRASALAEAQRLGLGTPRPSEVVTGRRAPVPSLVRLRAGGWALLLERSDEAARLFDPARGDVVLFATSLARWVEPHAEPLSGPGHP